MNISIKKICSFFDKTRQAFYKSQERKYPDLKRVTVHDDGTQDIPDVRAQNAVLKARNWVNYDGGYSDYTG